MNHKYFVELARLNKIKGDLLPLEERVNFLKNQYINELKNSGEFVFEGKAYPIKNIRYTKDYYYDDCPYTPGFRYSGETIKIGDIYGVRHASNSEWYKKEEQIYKDIKVKFKEQLGVAFDEVIPLENNK